MGVLTALTSDSNRPEGPLSSVREPGALEATLHDLANAVAAARSYAEVLRNRSRIGALHHPEPVLDYLLDELERLGDLSRDVRRRARDDATRDLARTYDEILAPAESAIALLDMVEREAARLDEPAAADVAGLSARARDNVLRIRGLAAGGPARPEAVDAGDIDAEAVLGGVLAGLGSLILERQAVVVRDQPLPSAHADATALADVLTLLVGGALRANPDRFPEVEILGRVRPDGLPEIVVRDNGPSGVSPARRVVECRNLVEAMGGKLVVEATPLDDGTVVRIVLNPPRLAPAL